jgi:hypothetical protein
MNSMMTISHRLFAAAIAEGPSARKPRPVTGKPVVIEVGRGGVSPAWVNGRPVPSHPFLLRGSRLGA